MLSFTEENYLKAIFNLRQSGLDKITTNAISYAVDTAPASVTDMLHKLADKRLVNYEKYQGVSLTTLGKKSAVTIVRKHRLWELFLVTKLGYDWDEVHDIAEQLEHIQSDTLINKLDHFLGKPKWDPHGDPIPDERGNFKHHKNLSLITVRKNKSVVLSGVSDHSPAFLRYLKSLGLSPGTKIVVKEIVLFDGSIKIQLNKSKKIIVMSHSVAKNILVTND